MKEWSSSQQGAPLLAPGARIERRSGSDLHVLFLPRGAIPLSEGAAAILRLCNGRSSRAEIQIRLVGLGYRPSSVFLDPFLDAALERKWVVEIQRPPHFILSPQTVCTEH